MQTTPEKNHSPGQLPQAPSGDAVMMNRRLFFAAAAAAMASAGCGDSPDSSESEEQKKIGYEYTRAISMVNVALEGSGYIVQEKSLFYADAKVVCEETGETVGRVMRQNNGTYLFYSNERGSEPGLTYNPNYASSKSCDTPSELGEYLRKHLSKKPVAPHTAEKN